MTTNEIKNKETNDFKKPLTRQQRRLKARLIDKYIARETIKEMNKPSIAVSRD